MSEPQSAPSQSYPTQPKSLSRGKYVAAIIVLSILLVGASGATAYLYYNPRTVTVTVDRTADLNSQIASLNSQISSDRSTIADLNTRIDAANQRISTLLLTQCTPDSGYTSCSAEVVSLQSQVSQLQSEKATLQVKIDQLTAQLNNLTDIVNMKKKTVIAESKTINWSACGDSGQPSCTVYSPYILPNTFFTYCSSTCYAGYLNLTWTSTQHLSVSFTYSLGSGTSTTSTGTASSGTFVMPVLVGVSTSTAGFHIDACSTDIFANIHCPGGTMTYSETYVY